MKGTLSDVIINKRNEKSNDKVKEQVFSTIISLLNIDTIAKHITDSYWYSQTEFSHIIDKVVKYLSKTYTITMVSTDDNSSRIYYHLPD